MTANEKQKKYGNRVNIKTASWLDVLDELHIWMYCILGCIVYLEELVIIGLGIRLRQGFAGEGLRIGYKLDDRSHPKIKQKKRASKISLQSSLYKRRRLPTLPHCIAVPSAQTGLTSLFGMGRGGTPPQ